MTIFHAIAGTLAACIMESQPLRARFSRIGNALARYAFRRGAGWDAYDSVADRLAGITD